MEDRKTNHHSHHSHHTHHHVDESEMFKNRALSSARKRKIWARRGFILLLIIAIIIVFFCFYAYFLDK